MYAIYVSVGAGLLVGLLVMLFWPWYAAIAPALVVTAAVFFFLLKRTLDKLQGVFAASMQALESGPKPQDVATQNPKALELLQNQRFDAALKKLEEGYALAKWIVTGASQLDGQRGYLYYLKKDFDKAEPLLKNAFYKNHMARLLYAACLFRKKSYDEMEAALEANASSNKDQPLVWGVYAWLMSEAGRPEKALAALSKGTEANASDEALKTNLLALQNKKKLNMKIFGDVWYQFWFEELPHKRMVPQHPRFQAMSRRRR